jgi:hypothetical protein
MTALLCSANISDVTKAHYSFIRNFVKTEIENERVLIRNIDSTIDRKKELNVTGINQIIRNDEIGLLQLQMENEKNFKTALKLSKKEMNKCLKEDLLNLNNKEMRKLLEKEIVRQADRDSQSQAKLEGITGSNQQQQRIHMYALFLEKELSFMRGTVAGCKSKVCNA